MTSPSLLEIFKAFMVVGASAFGGGGSAHIHNHIVVRRGWLSEREFLEGLSLSQLLPGPIFANFAAHIGMKLHGTWGAILAFVGVCLPGMLAILGLSVAYFTVRNFSSAVVTGALTGVAAGAVGHVGRRVIGKSDHLARVLPGDAAMSQFLIFLMIVRQHFF